MVTHDVDEALLLADRIVLMTNGPAATVGEIVTVPFERPRDRLTIIDDPRYHQARKQLLSFLEDRAAPSGSALASVPARQTAVAARKVTAEELFVIEKFTGFNRFRKKYRQPHAPAEFVNNLRRGGSEGALVLAILPARTGRSQPVEKIHNNGIERWEKSYCPYCGVGCGLLAGMRSGTVARIKGDPDHPSSLGDLCLKAVYLPEVLQTPDRLVYPQAAPMSGRPFQARFLAAGDDLFGETVSRDHRRARSGCRRFLRFGPADDRGVLRRQQAGERISRHQ